MFHLLLIKCIEKKVRLKQINCDSIIPMEPWNEKSDNVWLLQICYFHPSSYLDKSLSLDLSVISIELF